MILLISAVFLPEPLVSAFVTNDLAEALSENWKVTVISPKPTRPLGFLFNKEPDINRKFKHFILSSYTCPKSKLIGRMIESYSFGKHAVRFIKKNKTDIKCIYLNAWPLFAQFLIIKTAKKYCIPSVTQIMDIYPETIIKRIPFFKKLFTKLLLPIDKYIHKNSSKVVTISPNMKNYLVKTREMDERNIEVIHLWQNEQRFIEFKNKIKNKQSNSLFTFMFLGSLSKTAAIHVIILAFKISCLQNSRLIIAGDGPEKDFLISLARDCAGLSIEFWDAPILKVPEIQDQADVLILSLKKDAAHYALPSKLPAYMFSKKPIIACVEEDSDTAKAIMLTNCGWVVTPENVVALAKIMNTAISVPKEDLFQYGLNGFNYALENYSKRNNLRRLVTIIDELVTTLKV